MNSYKVLNKNNYSSGEYSIVPIRMEDRYKIMNWRNEQIYHLRQNKPLSRENQDNYFKNVVSQLFDQEKPDQILFSFLKNGDCIGYGGLVHINWTDKNAEISFVMDTHLEKEFFEKLWIKFLSLLEQVAFQELHFHKIFTYAFDLRPKLYSALEKKGFKKEAILIDHCRIDRKFKDVIIHSKINFNGELTFREAKESDANLLFKWANDLDVRFNSLNPESIQWVDHINWFKNKLSDKNSRIYIFCFDDEPVGQVRLDFENNSWVIDYSVDRKERGKGYGTAMIQKIMETNKDSKIKAMVKTENIGSIKVFEKLRFKNLGKKEIEGKDMVEFIYFKK